MEIPFPAASMVQRSRGVYASFARHENVMEVLVNISPTSPSPRSVITFQVHEAVAQNAM